MRPIRGGSWPLVTMGIDCRVSYAFCLVGALAVGCQPEAEGPVLMWEQYDVVNGNERHMGSGCADVYTSMGSSTGFAGGANVEEFLPPHSVEFRGDTHSVTVIIATREGQVLATERYPAEVLRARQEDELLAEFPNGYMRMKVWGREICEELRVPPGD